MDRRSQNPTRVRVGNVVKVRPGLCDGDEVGTVIDVTDFAASDTRTWRQSVSVEFRDGRRNLYTEGDLTVLR